MIDLLPPLGVGTSLFDGAIFPTRGPLLFFAVVVVNVGDTLAPLFTLSTFFELDLSLIATMALKLLQSEDDDDDVDDNDNVDVDDVDVDDDDDDDDNDDDDETIRQFIVGTPPIGTRPSSFRRPAETVVEVFDVFNLTVAG